MVSKRRSLALAAGFIATAATAAAQVKPYKADDWRAPGEAAMLAAWPAAAKPDTYLGGAFLDCAVDGSGAPADCKVTGEEPLGEGFGEAAIKLAEGYRLKGKSAGGRYALLVGFQARGYAAPTWLRRPTAAELVSVWPRKAWAEQVSGAATLTCKINLQGSLTECVVAAEQPAGMGFGGAAVTLTPQLLMRPATLNGKPVVTSVSLPFVFEAQKGQNRYETGSRVRKGDTFLGDRIITSAVAWTETPTYAEVVAAYPTGARADKIGGRATLDCTFTRQGRLTTCSAVREEPRGKGFGSAAVSLARRFQGPTTLGEGTSIAGTRVQLPFTFAPDMLGDGPPMLGNPTWARLPAAEEMISSFPAAARQAKIATGRVILACTVQPAGAIACTVEGEEPAGHGFGEAALKIAPLFRMQTWTLDGLPTVGRALRVPIRFQDEQAAAAGTN